MECKHIGCERPHRAKGLCKLHYDRLQKVNTHVNQKVGDTCKKGHLLEGDNVQMFKTRLGNDAVRCRTCNLAAGKRVKYKLGNKCLKGHVLTPETTRIHNNPTGNSLICRTCETNRRKERWAERVNSPEYQAQKLESVAKRGTVKRTRKEQARAERYDKILAVELDGNTTGKYTGLNYLKLNKRSQRAWVPLEEAFDRTTSKCYENPGPYIDYDEDAVPLASQAYKLCEGCPMLVECARFASAYKPVIGVWGGEVWIDGKVVR